MNRLIKPLIVLVILVAVVLVVRYTGTDRSRPDADISFAVNLDPEKIERVEITRGEQQVVLLNGATGWSVKTPFGIKPADSETILAAVNDLSGIANARLVSHNPEKQEEYRVDETSGTLVKFVGEADKMLAELVVGRLGGFQQRGMMAGRGQINPDDLYTFMRHAGSDNVFRVKGFFASITGTDCEQWRQHNLCSFTADQVTRLALDSGGRPLVLEPDTAGSWSMLEPEQAPADPDTVDQMLRSLGTLRADGFQDTTLTDQELGLDSPSYRLAVSLSDGREVQLEIGREFKENFFYARKPGEEQVYTLARYRLDQIMKSPASVKATGD
ncbi:MAG: DUF4340 domain-containing protein [Candidatus Glassbacteria bacterium]|nr:DUF4340 domain-containing protein [Candidatus Glassbacteria bacterium]